MNGKRVKELNRFIKTFYPDMEGDRRFRRMVKKRFKAVRGGRLNEELRRRKQDTQPL